MYQLLKELPIIGLRYPRIIDNILIGSKEYRRKGDMIKYVFYRYQLDDNLDIIEHSGRFISLENIVDECLNNNNISYWMRDCYKVNNHYQCLIEFKYNMNNSTYKHRYFIVTSSDLLDYKIIKEIEYPSNYFIFKQIGDYILTSKITKDEDNPNYFWGKYLFEFNLDEKLIRPRFDSIVNYNKDKGHVLHYVRHNDKGYNILFSIRHQIVDSSTFMYKIYTANSNDLIHFYNTQEMEVDFHNINTEWLSYPSIFIKNNKEFIVCNQDEFGKSKGVLILSKV